MHPLFEDRSIAHRLAEDTSGRFASEYFNVIAYIAVATGLGAVLFGDRFGIILNDIRRALLGNNFG